MRTHRGAMSKWCTVPKGNAFYFNVGLYVLYATQCNTNVICDERDNIYLN